jgi:hypothetical protein
MDTLAGFAVRELITGPVVCLGTIASRAEDLLVLLAAADGRVTLACAIKGSLPDPLI